MPYADPIKQAQYQAEWYRKKFVGPDGHLKKHFLDWQQKKRRARGVKPRVKKSERTEPRIKAKAKDVAARLLAKADALARQSRYGIEGKFSLERR